jgi:hypothetical protein
MPRASKPQSGTPTGPRLVRKSATTPSAPPPVTHEQIATRAYEIYESEGHGDGHHVDHWLRAERELVELTAVRPKSVSATRARR